MEVAKEMRKGLMTELDRVGTTGRRGGTEAERRKGGAGKMHGPESDGIGSFEGSRRHTRKADGPVIVLIEK